MLQFVALGEFIPYDYIKEKALDVFDKKINKNYYIILINVSKEDLAFCSNLNLVDSEIINTRGYYIYSNKIR